MICACFPSIDGLGVRMLALDGYGYKPSAVSSADGVVGTTQLWKLRDPSDVRALSSDYVIGTAWFKHKTPNSFRQSMFTPFLRVKTLKFCTRV